jgi:hypothetical protein
MKAISEDTIVGILPDGNIIEAERLQKWAYRQISIAPDLLFTCQTALDVLAIGGDIENLKQTLRTALKKAEVK